MTIANSRKNVFLIVVDDLRPQMFAYNASFMWTPEVDSLAAQGILFSRAYVQQSICSPSRNSFLSGRYPDKTQAWNFIDSFRDGPGANWTALPEFFKRAGYFVTGAGKIYHPNHPEHFDEPRSWSEPWLTASYCDCGGDGKFPPGGFASCEGLDPSGLSCGDDTIVEAVTEKLARAANGTLGRAGQKWFIAAGLHKPHLPFYARPGDFARYPTPAAPHNPLFPFGAPYCAYHSCLSNALGSNYSNWGNFSDIPNSMSFERPMEAATAARLRRGYYASVSYTDHNVGLLLKALDGPGGPRSDVVVALIGDHGWSLGEGNEFCKMTNTEVGTRIPFIIRALGIQFEAGRTVHQLVEVIDLYRTLYAPPQLS